MELIHGPDAIKTRAIEIRNRDEATGGCTSTKVELMDRAYHELFRWAANNALYQGERNSVRRLLCRSTEEHVQYHAYLLEVHDKEMYNTDPAAKLTALRRMRLPKPFAPPPELVVRFNTISPESNLGADKTNNQNMHAQTAAAAAALQLSSAAGNLELAAHKAHTRTLLAFAQQAVKASEEETVRRFRERWELRERAGKSTVAAVTVLAANASQVSAWLRDKKPLAGFGALAPEAAQLNPATARDWLARAISSSATPPPGMPQGAPPPSVLSTTNDGSPTAHGDKASIRLARRQIEIALEGARTDHGMHHLGPHREPASGPAALLGAEWTNKNIGHAEPLVIGLAMGDPDFGLEWKGAPPPPNPRGWEPRCLLLLVSRWSCNSCVYVLPFIAVMLKVDIVVQCLLRNGELSHPLSFTHDGRQLPTKQAAPAARL